MSYIVRKFPAIALVDACQFVINKFECCPEGEAIPHLWVKCAFVLDLSCWQFLLFVECTIVTIPTDSCLNKYVLMFNMLCRSLIRSVCKAIVSLVCPLLVLLVFARNGQTVYDRLTKSVVVHVSHLYRPVYSTELPNT